MGANSNIEWTHHTWNPWWGCTKVSAGCTNCYADTLSTRYGFDVWGPKAPRRFFGEKHWQEPLKWNKQAEKDGERRRVFCASMADVFEQHMVPAINDQMDQARWQLWEVIEQTPTLNWLLLTKRPENVEQMTPWGFNWPRNVWLGTSVENQEQVDPRISALISVPAHVRFLSCEPLIGPVRLDGWLGGLRLESPIHWVIAGGESGNGARPMAAAWARSLRDQCQAADVAFFFKQWGGRIAKSGGRTLDGRTWDEFPQAVPA